MSPNNKEQNDLESIIQKKNSFKENILGSIVLSTVYLGIMSITNLSLSSEEMVTPTSLYIAGTMLGGGVVYSVFSYYNKK